MHSRYIDTLNKHWSAVTLGCWQLAPSLGWGDICSAQSADRVVKTALDAGITAFDTAEGYGEGVSEARLAEALGSKRDEVIVISKIWPDAEITLEAYTERLENSLRRLRREYVDVYLVHWAGDIFDTPEKNAALCQIMGRLKASGKARMVGVSNFSAQNLNALGSGIGCFDINQIPYSLLDRSYEAEALNLCKEHGLHYMAYAPTAKGLLAQALTQKQLSYPARKNNSLCSPEVLPHAQQVFGVLSSLATELNYKPIHLALRWVLAQENILTSIVGSRKPEQIEELSTLSDIELSSDVLEELTRASNVFLEATS